MSASKLMINNANGMLVLIISHVSMLGQTTQFKLIFQERRQKLRSAEKRRRETSERKAQE